MISMEESEKTDRILSIYKEVSAEFENLGITLQVRFKRSADDLNQLLQTQGRIRLVKGAYQEPEATYIPRSNELNERYIDFAKKCISTNHLLSIASHDQSLLDELESIRILSHSLVEVEMLDGVGSNYLQKLIAKQVNTKVYITYGTEWYLYLAHRIAEYPPNIYTFVSDIVEGSFVNSTNK